LLALAYICNNELTYLLTLQTIIWTIMISLRGESRYSFCKRLFLFVISVIMMSSAFVSAQNPATPQMVIADYSVSGGGVVQIPVKLKNNASAFCAFQFTMVLPDGIRPIADSDTVSVVLNGGLLSDHEVRYSCLDSLLIVNSVSMTNALFKADTGVICYVRLVADIVTAETAKTIRVKDVEYCTPNVQMVTPTQDLSFTLTIKAPEVDPDFRIDIDPFTISGSIESSIVIESSVDIRSISFVITIPELMAEYRLVSFFSRLLLTSFNTDITEIDDRTYSVSIESLSDSVIRAGSTQIAGISANKAIALLPAGDYVFNLDSIAVTAANGKVYTIKPFEYRLDLSLTQVKSLMADTADEPVEYYSLDGRRIPEPAQGVTLVRYADGRVSKIIIR